MDKDYVQLGFKGFEGNESIVENSVVEEPSSRGGVHRMILSIAEVADDIPAWSTNPHARDIKLREYLPTEPLLISTVYAAIARVAGFSWLLKPKYPEKEKPKNTLRAVNRMLYKWSDRGEGWINLIQKTFMDLYTQDNGAFWELIRKENTPSAPVISFAHLDSARCQRTGNSKTPIIYTDIQGKDHYLNWWQVHTFEDMPSAKEDAYGVGYSAVTRALLAAQILRDISVYKREKVSGSFHRAIYLVSGPSQQEIDDGIAWSREQMLNLGNYRYSQPVIIPNIDPQHPVNVERIDLASLPDAFDEDSTLKWYVAQLAAAFGLDYQEIAPLPGGNLGSSQQADILHQKTQGKGPALAMAKIEDALNNHGYLPNTIEFGFEEHDLSSDKAKAETSFVRSKNLSMLINSGILDPQGALDLAVDQGDIPEHIANQIMSRGLVDEWYQSRIVKNQAPIEGSNILGGIESHGTRD
jgi:hypothetical protein